MRYCCMFEIMTIHMHKLVKISGIVNRQPWNRLNSYAAHSVFWARRKQDGVQIMSWRYSVYPGTLVGPIPTGRRHCPIFICSLNLEQGVVDRKSQYVTAGRCFPPECAVHKRWHHWPTYYCIIIIIIYSSLRFRRIKYNAMYTYKGIITKAYITN